MTWSHCHLEVDSVPGSAPVLAWSLCLQTWFMGPFICDLICTSDLQINGNASCKICDLVIQLLCLCHMPPTSILFCRARAGILQSTCLFSHIIPCWILLIWFTRGRLVRKREEKGLILLINCSYRYHLNINFPLCPKQFVWFSVLFPLTGTSWPSETRWAALLLKWRAPVLKKLPVPEMSVQVGYISSSEVCGPFWEIFLQVSRL